MNDLFEIILDRVENFWINWPPILGFIYMNKQIIDKSHINQPPTYSRITTIGSMIKPVGDRQEKKPKKGKDC